MRDVDKFIQDIEYISLEVHKQQELLMVMCDKFADLLEENINSIDFAGTIWTLRVADSLSTTVPYRLQLHLDLDLRSDCDNTINEERFSWIRIMQHLDSEAELHASIQLDDSQSSTILTIKKYRHEHTDSYQTDGLFIISVYIDFGSIDGLVKFLDQKKVVLSGNGLSLEKNKINNALKEFSSKALFIAQVEDALSNEQVAGYYGELTKKDN